MKFPIHSLTLTLLLGTLVACGGSDPLDPTNDPSQEPTEISTVEQVRLEAAATDEAFFTTLKAGLDGLLTDDRWTTDGLPISNPPVDNAAESKPAGDFSTTNIQVTGVDEGDVIKSDGYTLFYLESSLSYSEYCSQPGYYNRCTGKQELAGETLALRPVTSDLIALDVNPVSRIKLPGSLPNASTSLYLADTNNDTRADQLVVLRTSTPRYWTMDSWRSPWSWRNGVTEMFIYGVKDPAAPELLHQAKIEGYLLESRRIGQTVYLITRFTPDVTVLDKPATENKGASAGDSTPRAKEWDQWLPTIAYPVSGYQQPLALPTQCLLPTLQQKQSGSLLSITAIDLSYPESPKTLCYLGDLTGFYASGQSFYITDSIYRWYREEDSALVDQSKESMTIIHKFGLSKSGPMYEATGLVPGTLGSNNPAYRMNEKDGYLGIVTSDTRRQHKLHILENTGNRRLESIASLPNSAFPEPLGKPNEDIYAARFLRQRLYLVTFERTDPFYVIDLKDMRNPVLLGELKLPGYSSYLLPVDDDLVLGIGKEVVTEGTIITEKGVKLSLFDVSDPKKPFEAATFVAGDSGSNSPALSDPHALAWLPGNDTRAHRLALPIAVHYPGDTLTTSSSCRTRWHHTALYLFDINSASASAKPSITHHLRLKSDAPPEEDPGCYFAAGYLLATDHRAVISEKFVDYLHVDPAQNYQSNTITSSRWPDGPVDR